MHVPALTCRSFYSFLRGAVSVERLIQKAREYGYSAVALADVNSMSGLIDFCKTAKANNIIPLIGVEILTDNQKVILLAENRTGYRNLCRITTAINLDPGFCLFEQFELNSDGLICISSQYDLLKRIRKFLDKDHLFAGCKNRRDLELAKKLKLKPVACDTFNIVADEDISTSRILEKIRRMSVEGPGPEDGCGFNKLLTIEQLKARFADFPQVLRNTEQILYRCDLDLLDGRLFLPKVNLSNGKKADVELARLCHVGLAKKYRPAKKETIKRLENELSVIKQNGFSDYFLVVYRIVDFAKQNRIPVEIRGSAAGSLVSYVLGFTRVCPIENNLYFERFMNAGRKDCPDIDIDLCWRRRDDVIRFCYENWGYDHVAMISNINRYRYRSAVRDVARTAGLKPAQINRLFDESGRKDAIAILEQAKKLIGIPRHFGVHCGGVVITPGPVSDVAPLELATKGVIVTQYDKDAAEAAGLIKIDLLGNRSLSTVDESVTLVSKSGKALEIDSIDPFDEKTAKMLSAGDSLGVFQCESPGMRQLLRAIKVKNKKDAAIALSLIRPGPASGGMKTEFIERYVNKKPFTYLHPRMENVLGGTFGVMLYQEDVMRIAVDVAGYSIAEADRFRSEVSKKVSATRLQRQYEDFVYFRAERLGVDRQTAEAIWEQILKFAAYSYCKAHATVYANIAWQTAYLKAHYPQQFYTAILNNHHGMYPLRVYAWDAIRHGIRILPPHVNKSDIEWRPEGKAIRAGLNIIKGLSINTMNEIVSQRNHRLFTDVADLRIRVRFRGPELPNLIHLGACDGLGLSRPYMLMRLRFTPINPHQLLLFDIYKAPRKAFSDYSRTEKLNAEVDLTGIPFSIHPAVLLNTKHTDASRLSKYIDRQVTVAGYLAAARLAKTNDGKVMGFVTLEDSSGLAEVTFFPDQIEKYESLYAASGPVWVTGKVNEHLSSITVEATTCGTAA
jgi:DNA polymerase III alpha subunit